MSSKSSEQTRVKLSGTLGKLPRVGVSAKPAPNESAVRSADKSYEVKSSADIAKAFSIKRHLLKS